MKAKILMTNTRRSRWLKNNYPMFDIVMGDIKHFTEEIIEKFDLVVIQSSEQQRYIHEQGLMANNVICVDKHIFEILDDKMKTYEFIENMGLGDTIPDYRTPTLPYIMKPLESQSGSVGISLHETDVPDKEGFYKQNYELGDKESTFTVFVKNGEVKHIKKSVYDMKKYKKEYGRVFKEPKLIDYIQEVEKGIVKIDGNRTTKIERDFIEKVSKEMEINGVVNFQTTMYKGELRFFEINPRPNGYISQFFAEFINKYIEVFDITIKNRSQQEITHFVYPYILPKDKKFGWELLYSIRSVFENFEGPFDLTIIGDVPDWVNRFGVKFIKLDNHDISAQRQTKINQKILKASEYYDKFLLMNDDICFIEKCSIEDFKEPCYISEKFDMDTRSGVNSFYSQNKNALNQLKDLGKPHEKNFTSHTPFFYESDKIDEIQKDINLASLGKSSVVFETAYFNYFGVKGKPAEGFRRGCWGRDCPKPDGHKILNFDERGASLNPWIKEFLENKFNEKCKVEI